MTVPLDSVTDPPLAPAASDEAYALYRAAVEWGLASPLSIRSAKDILSAAVWKDRVQPYHHQVQNLVTFCRIAPAALVADEVGLGKTISAGLILSELVARRRITRSLVVCPKVLCGQWVAELADKFRVESVEATGANLRAAIQGGPGVVVTTYETAKDYLSDIPSDEFGLLILDEAHRLRNLHGNGRPPQVAQAVRDALARRLFTYVLMLTATPVQNRLWDVYSLIDLLTLAKGHRNPFGDPAAFRARFLQPGHDGRRLQPGMGDRFRQFLRGYVARTRRVDAGLPFPNRQVRLETVPLSTIELDLDRAVGRVIGKIQPAVLQSSLGQALMSSPAALAAQLANMSGKSPELSGIAALAHLAARSAIPPAKLDRLLRVCRELQAARPLDWRVVVFTGRTETQEMIRRALMANGIPVGLICGGRHKENQRDIAAFAAKPPALRVLVSTDAGTEGVNLQTANWVVNYDMPWNPMRLEQRIGRVQRLGSTHETVVVLNLVAAGTAEEAVVARLMQKLLTVTDTVGDLESILAGVVGDHEDGREERFEKMLRELVVQSLQGLDATHSARLRADSIERARRDYEAHSAEMGRELGRLDEIHSAGTPPPSFERAKPTLPADQFVLRAWAAEGRTVRAIDPGVYSDPAAVGDARRLVIDPAAAAVTNGVPEHLYVPGHPPFDRLAERWAGRRTHRVIDLRSATEAAAGQVARKWCANYPGLAFRSCRVRSRKPFISGRVLVVASATTGVDQHQKVVEHPIGPGNHHSLPAESLAAGPLLGEQVSLGGVTPNGVEQVRRAIAADAELNEFVRYYTARRINELSRAGDDPHLRRRVEADFTASVEAEVVGFQGACYEEVVLEVRFAVEGGEYTATLQAIPVTGQLIEQPTVERCPVSGTRMPFGVLGKCDRTGRMVPKHRLYESEVSHRRVVREYLKECEVTGKLAVDDELEVSVVSGRRTLRELGVRCERTGGWVLRDEAERSAVSGTVVRRDLLHSSERPPHRLGLEEELRTCEETKAKLLVDEVSFSEASGLLVDDALLVRSDLSDRRALLRELVTCEVSGKRGVPSEMAFCSLTNFRVDVRLVTRSAVSGATALTDRMVVCEASGAMAIPGELIQCAESGKWVVPALTECCAVSGARDLRSKMIRCEVSGAWLLPKHAEQSSVSGKWVDRSLLTVSQMPPGRLGLRQEFVICAETNRWLLTDEAGISDVSRRTIGLDRMVISSVSGLRAAVSETVECDESHARILPDEAGHCAETGLTVDRRLLAKIGPPDRLVLKRLTSKCAKSGRLVLARELERCTVTGELMLPAWLETCAGSGVRAARSQLQRCAVTGKWFRPVYLAASAVSGRWASRKSLIVSEMTAGRLGLPDEVVVCAVTRRRLLTDEVVPSAVSGRVVGRDLVVPSAASGRLALPDEMEVCEASRARLLPDELDWCTETKQRVDRRLLTPVGRPSRLVLAHLTDVCSKTGRRVPVRALERCAITGELVLSSELETCAISGVRRLRDAMVRSSVSGRYAVPDHAHQSPISGKTLLADEGIRCRWSGQRVLPKEARKCAFTEVPVTKCYLNDSGQLAALANLLDRTSAIDASSIRNDFDPRVQRLLESLDPLFQRIIHGGAVRSPDGQMLAIVVAVNVTRWLVSSTEYIGLLLRDGPIPRIIGKGIQGRRDSSGEFTANCSLDFS